MAQFIKVGDDRVVNVEHIVEATLVESQGKSRISLKMSVPGDAVGGFTRLFVDEGYSDHVWSLVAGSGQPWTVD